ncbi:GC-rich sequence DNA-binding factor-like protein-domain-containing protein [Coemansia spiralis]|nr:GC-rich sequence DNA-binding factor-like protein-domain-containing protein [Coemansia spiralis]
MDDDYRPILGLADSSDEEETDDSRIHSGRQWRVARTKEEEMLGIWAESDNEYQKKDNGRPETRATRDKPSTQTLKPTVFIPASSSFPDSEKDTVDLKNGIESADDSNSSNSNDSDRNGNSLAADLPDQLSLEKEDGSDSSESKSDSSFSSSSESEDSNDTEQSELDDTETKKAHFTQRRDLDKLDNRPTKQLQKPISKEFGKFANSKVWNMMSMMGYKPGEGLGKHGEGRVEPIQPVLRRSGEGISFSRRERPPEPLPAESPLGFKSGRRKEVRTKEETTGSATLSRSKQAEAARAKIEYKTLEELQQRTDTKLKEVFVDMTTNTQVGSLEELVVKKLPLSEKEQLARDARLGLDLSFSRLEHIKREKAIEANRLTALAKDISILSTSIEQRKTKVGCLQKIKNAVEAVYTKANDTRASSMESASMDMTDLYLAYEELYHVARQMEKTCGFNIWQELQLERVVTATMFDQLQHIFHIWVPTEHLQHMANLLSPLIAYVSVNDISLSAKDMSPFESLLDSTLVPRLRQFIYTDWDPLSDSLGKLLDYLPQITIAAISEDICTMLRRLVDGINVRAVMDRYRRELHTGTDIASVSGLLAALRIDHAIIPWLPFVAEHKELLASVRRKLCTALEFWEPSKQSNNDIITLVSPWLQVLQDKDQHRLSTKIADRLESMLQTEFQFNAQQQKLWAFKAFAKWYGILPFGVWFAVAKRQVISKFLDYLWIGLSNQVPIMPRLLTGIGNGSSCIHRRFLRDQMYKVSLEQHFYIWRMR